MARVQFVLRATNTLLLFFCLTALRGQVWQWATMHDISGEGWTVTNDNNGNTFLGSFIGGTATIGTTTITGNGIKGITTKYDLNGNLLWAQYVAGGPVYGVDCDNNGNVYSVGAFSNTLTVGPNTYTTSGTNDIFLIKYDNAGNFQWVRIYGGAPNEVCNAISVDSQDNPVITGYLTAGTSTFGALSIVSTTNTYFAAKLDGSGNCLWVTNSSAGYSQGLAVSADLSGNVFISGIHQGMTLGTNTLSTLGSMDYFIAKLNSNGVPLWVSTGGTTGADGGVNVSSDPYGDVYLLGRFTGSTLVVANQTLNVAGSSMDMFLTKYTSGGTNLWAQAYTHPGVQQPYGLAAYNGGVYFTAGIGVTNYTIGNFTLTSSSATDGLLLANVGSSGNLQYATALSGGGDDVMALHMDNMCNLTLGGDLQASNVQVGNTIFTHTASEALFVAKFNSGNTTPTLSIVGPSTLCAAGTITLSVSGASTYTWSTGAVSNSIVVSPTSNTVFAVIGLSPSYTCQAKLSQSISVLSSTVSISATNTLICQGSSATLSVLGANTYSWSNSSQQQSVVVTPSQTTTYSVSGLGSVGCPYQAVKTISTLAAPALSVSATQFTVCKGNTYTITASGATSYTWNNGTHTTTISALAQANAVFSVSGSNTGTTCIATRTIGVTVAPCTGVNEEEILTKFSIYPNPSDGRFNFRTEGLTAAEIWIYDLEGHLVEHFIMAEGMIEHQVSLTKAGLYLLRVNSSEGFHSNSMISVQ